MTTDQKTSNFPLWVRVLFLFSCGGAFVAMLALLTPDGAVDTVEEQLVALNDNRISQAYYEYTSKEFQKTTSIKQFKEFLSIYPVLFETRSYRLKLEETDENRAQVSGVLVSQGLEEMQANWGLVKENEEWKVVSLRLTELINEEQGSRITSQMINLVKKQLKALRDREMVEAYYGFVSKDFQQQTSRDDFEGFIKDNPILVNYRSISSEEGRVENDRGYVTLALENENGSYLLEYTLSRELGEWKVFSLKVVLPPEVAVQKAATNPEALVPPVKDLLEALASEQPYRAYKQTSKDFQDATSFENFQKFISSFPALSRRELADIKRGEIQNGTGTVRVNLHDDEGITTLEFRMGFSEGEWFVWGMEVIDAPERKDETINTIVEIKEPPLADQLMAILRQQMAYLYHQDIYEAYALMMSEEYQDENTMDEFEEFFSAHPMFLDHRTSYFNRILEQDDQVVLRGFLTTFDEETFPVRFDFTKEEGKWKIDGMFLLEKHEPIAEAEEVLDKAEEDLPPKPIEFTNIVIGTEVDDQGIVTTPLEAVKGDTDLLFFNVNLVNGQPKVLVTLYLEHVDSGSTAPPLSTMLEKKGDSMISFSYAAPKKGWPPGDYIVKVRTTTGQEHLSKFKVDEKVAE